ncbi:hypothetical protein [Nocardiopsis synnemataformans]|uniref:hypothetical protein n=1 Tax=Nocardiopsis synnemataformans TaxID=61305 RepID=UPI003EBAEC64
MPLTDTQWMTFTTAFPYHDYNLSVPEDIDYLWERFRQVFLDREDELRLPEVEGVCLWDTSDESNADLIMTVDLPGGLRVASLTFTPTSLYARDETGEPCGPQPAREVIDSLLDMRSRLVTEAQQNQSGPAAHQPGASRSPLALAELCERHGRAYLLSSDPATGTTELRVTWPTDHPNGPWSLCAEWAPGHSTRAPHTVRVRHRDPHTGERTTNLLPPGQVVDLITGSDPAPTAGSARPDGGETVTVKDLSQALFEADQECLSPAARVVVAHNGAPDLGDPVTAVQVLAFRIDPDTGSGLLGADAEEHPDADPALILFTEH